MADFTKKFLRRLGFLADLSLEEAICPLPNLISPPW